MYFERYQLKSNPLAAAFNKVDQNNVRLKLENNSQWEFLMATKAQKRQGDFLLLDLNCTVTLLPLSALTKSLSVRKQTEEILIRGQLDQGRGEGRFTDINSTQFWPKITRGLEKISSFTSFLNSLWILLWKNRF